MKLLHTTQLSAAAARPRRRDKVVPRFLLRTDGLSFQAVLSQLQPRKSTEETQESHIDKYSLMLEKAKDNTFTCPVGQLAGRAGRRCTLEDGERLLEWCIQERPWDLQPRVILLRNLMKQGLGRERDVPWLAIQALQQTGVEECDISSECYVQVLQAVLLGLKAIYKLELSGEAVPADPCQPRYTQVSFLLVAQAVVPGMSQDLLKMSQRLHRQLVCCGDEDRAELLHDRDGYMSCVDLHLVAGEHHAGLDVARGVTAGGLRQPVQARAYAMAASGGMPQRKFRELRL